MDGEKWAFELTKLVVEIQDLLSDYLDAKPSRNSATDAGWMPNGSWDAMTKE